MNEKEVKETMASLNTLVGLEEEDAIKQLKDAGWKVRVVARDGEIFMRTMDYWEDRANLSTNNGKITKISIG